eukprot:TRINITY_DN12285_c3_g1_i1.p2 TRINITY_DN12285_c3_g1~~TRINITY_DN12285_c3_g1_i1.p2  ORF type:complete len:312 (+),score=117.81 TRINITY_DN12285_c3_g1_i1:55-990(+)
MEAVGVVVGVVLCGAAAGCFVKLRAAEGEQARVLVSLREEDEQEQASIRAESERKQRLIEEAEEAEARRRADPPRVQTPELLVVTPVMQQRSPPPMSQSPPLSYSAQHYDRRVQHRSAAVRSPRTPFMHSGSGFDALADTAGRSIVSPGVDALAVHGHRRAVDLELSRRSRMASPRAGGRGGYDHHRGYDPSARRRSGSSSIEYDALPPQRRRRGPPQLSASVSGGQTPQHRSATGRGFSDELTALDEWQARPVAAHPPRRRSAQAVYSLSDLSPSGHVPTAHRVQVGPSYSVDDFWSPNASARLSARSPT